MNNKDLKKIIFYIIVALIILLIALVFDYYNIFSFISVNLNYDFLGILVNIIVIVLSFLVTYILIDSKLMELEKKNTEQTIEQINNKIDVLLTLLKKTYDCCIEEIEIIDNPETLKKYIVPKMDFNSTSDKLFNNLKNIPFESENYIIELFCDGTISRKYLDGYLSVKNSYQKFINLRITFFDAENYENSDVLLMLDCFRKEVYRVIREQQNLIKKDFK